MGTAQERSWLVLAATAVATGVMAGGSELGWPVTGSLIAVAASFAWFVAYTGCLGEGSFGGQMALWFAAGLAVVATIGLMELLGTVSLLIVGLVTLAHPAVRASLRVSRRRRTPRPPVAARSDAVTVVPAGAETAGTETARVDVLPDAGDFLVEDGVTTADLCLAWCSSYVALQRATTTSARLHAVEMRALYLDELERRMGPEFARWIASRPRAAQDPRRLLQARRPDR